MRDNDQSLKEALEEWLKLYKYNDKLMQSKVIASWNGVVGPIISKETEKLYISKKVLFVKLKSEALKHELEFAKRKLVKALNKQAGGAEIITDIMFV